MLYFFRLLFLLISIDQETILNWFGITGPVSQNGNEVINGLSSGNSDSSSSIAVETVRIIIEGLWNKLQSGLTLANIESILFFILFIRFVILAIKYNLKTSFYITCITFAAGYLWYRHLIDLMLMYKNVLLRLPFFHKLGVSTVQLQVIGRQNVKADIMLGENVHWYNVGKLLYYTFTRGIVDIDPETGLRYYIDPFSMVVSNLNEPLKSNILPYYYKVYNKWIPKIFSACSRFWTQLSGIAAYALVTRIGKKFCPYLVRWHWTFLLIIGFFEQVFISLTNRIIYFQSVILMPQLAQIEESGSVSTEYAEEHGLVNQIVSIDPDILLQVNALNVMLVSIVLIHMTFVFLGLLHAVCGQYFYIPFFVENAELHIGPRPKNSIYSGGYTSWQDEKEKNVHRRFPKVWYGWLGNQSEWKPVQALLYRINKLISLKLRKWRKKG